MLNAKKTIILWLVLIVLFVAFYQFFSVPPDPNAAPVPQGPRTDWFSIILGWAPFIVLFVGFILFMNARQRRFVPNNDGVKLLHQGHYVKALEVFEKFSKDHPKLPLGPFNAGSTRMQLWRLEAALRDFEAAQQLGAAKSKEMVALLPEHLALTHALLGRTADARRMLSEVPAGQADPGRVGVAEAILFLRAGDAARAREKLNIFEVKQLAGTLGALARTLDALCIEQLTGERRHVDRVALFGGTGPEDLRKAWPELIAFVERAPEW